MYMYVSESQGHLNQIQVYCLKVLMRSIKCFYKNASYFLSTDSREEQGKFEDC